eukprot:1270242-Amphidinium_carterae.1
MSGWTRKRIGSLSQPCGQHSGFTLEACLHGLRSNCWCLDHPKTDGSACASKVSLHVSSSELSLTFSPIW